MDRNTADPWWSHKDYGLYDLGDPYRLSVGDLSEWHVLKAGCGKCGAIEMIYPAALRRRYGPGESLGSLRPKLVCKRCGNRKGNRWTLHQIKRND